MIKNSSRAKNAQDPDQLSLDVKNYFMKISNKYKEKLKTSQMIAVNPKKIKIRFKF